MTLYLLLSQFLNLLPWLLAGLVLGAVYFVLLGRTVAAIEADAGWRRAAVFVGLRLVLATGAFALAAMQGTAPLVLTLLGFIAARMIAIRRVKGQG
ncbi:ATP synthase subunit I [Pseudophaeobacter sp. A-200-2]|uniref:N-ATPase subunit AtpR n=1 Tax=Pseudophaeobacter sp. A-200-2 TaxID=3098145 RepID=UPI0034D48FE0